MSAKLRLCEADIKGQHDTVQQRRHSTALVLGLILEASLHLEGTPLLSAPCYT